MSMEVFPNYWVVDGAVAPVHTDDGELLHGYRNDQHQERFTPVMLPIDAVVPSTYSAKSPEGNEALATNNCDEAIRFILELDGILVTGQPEQGEQNDTIMRIIANEYDISPAHGRTGLMALLSEGEIMLGHEINGQQHLVEFKGSGNPSGGFYYYEGMFGETVIYGGLTAEESKHEAAALLWNQSHGLTRQRLLAIKSVVINDIEHRMLAKLTNSTVRLHHRNAEPVARLDDDEVRRSIYNQLSKDILQRVLSTEIMPCFITTAPHLQNILVEPNNVVSLTDFEDQSLLGTDELPRLHKQTGTLLNNLEIIQEYFTIYELVRGYDETDFDHIAEYVIDYLLDNTEGSDLYSPTAIEAVAAATTLEELGNAVWRHYVVPVDMYRRAEEGQLLDKALLDDVSWMTSQLAEHSIPDDTKSLMYRAVDHIKPNDPDVKTPANFLRSANAILVAGFGAHHTELTPVVRRLTDTIDCMHDNDYTMLNGVEMSSNEAQQITSALESELRSSVLYARLGTLHTEYSIYAEEVLDALDLSMLQTEDTTAARQSLTLANELNRDLVFAALQRDVQKTLNTQHTMIASLRRMAYELGTLKIKLPHSHDTTTNDS